MAVTNRYYRGALKGIPVLMIAGDYFQKPGGRPLVWPNDGIVTVDSAFSVATSDRVFPHRRCRLFAGGTHSVYISKQAGLANDTAITWTPKVGAWVASAIAAGKAALQQPNRVGCPAS